MTFGGLLPTSAEDIKILTSILKGRTWSCDEYTISQRFFSYYEENINYSNNIQKLHNAFTHVDNE